MSGTRQKLLAQHFQAKAAVDNPDLPPNIRAMYKAALDKSQALLGLQDALARKNAAKSSSLPSETPPDSDPQTPQVLPQNAP